jgi:hypothetical protein
MNQSDCEVTPSGRSEPSSPDSVILPDESEPEGEVKEISSIDSDQEFISEDFAFIFQTVIEKRKITSVLYTKLHLESEVQSLLQYKWFSSLWDRIQAEKANILKTLLAQPTTTLKIGEVWMSVSELTKQYGNKTDILFEKYLNSYIGVIGSAQVHELMCHHYSMNTSLNSLLDTLFYDRSSKMKFTC